MHPARLDSRCLTSLWRLGTFSFFALLAFVPPARAWNWEGHRTIALLAWEHMNARTRAEVGAVLHHHPHADDLLMEDIPPGTPSPARERLMFANAANWPDMVRSGALAKLYSHADWHYVNLPVVPGDPAPVPGPALAGEIIPQIRANTTAYLDLRAELADRAIALCWVAHLISDIHQPLHAATLVQDDLKQGDLGGNLLLVRYEADAKTVMNLHAVWDSLLGTSYAFSGAENDAARILAAYPTLPEKEAQQLATDTTPYQWAIESWQIAKDSVYLDGQIPYLLSIRGEKQAAHDVPALPDGYRKRARAIADLRVALAALRLSRVLGYRHP